MRKGEVMVNYKRKKWELRAQVKAQNALFNSFLQPSALSHLCNYMQHIL